MAEYLQGYESYWVEHHVYPTDGDCYHYTFQHFRGDTYNTSAPTLEEARSHVRAWLKHDGLTFTNSTEQT